MKSLLLFSVLFICLPSLVSPQSQRGKIQDPLVRIHQQDSLIQILGKQPGRKEFNMSRENHLISKNNKYNKSSSVIYSPEKVICDDSIRYSYTYDNSGNCLTYTLENLVNHTWIYSWRHTFTYDNSGNYLTILHEEWSNSKYRENH